MELRLKFTSLICLLVFALPCFAKEPIRTIEGQVTNVSDGDTIQVTDQLGTKVKVRLYGIDAPEIGKGNRPGQPYGEEALQTLRQKVDRQRISLEVIDIDKYKRLVAIVWLPARNINLEMAEAGWAWAYRSYLDRAHASDYITAEGQARKAKKGLWQQDNPQPPWEVRKSMRRHKAIRSSRL